jgi:hypothetical protein
VEKCRYTYLNNTEYLFEIWVTHFVITFTSLSWIWNKIHNL